MDQNYKTLLDIKIEKTKNALIKNKMEAYVVDSIEQLHELISSMIPNDSEVNVGGSQSLFETNILDLLRTMPIVFNDRYDEKIPANQMDDLHRKAFFADYFITSSNAVTEDGLLYNVDGNGNRVAALTFGPKNVIVVVGQNKIVKNIEAAISRVREIAAPANALRLSRDTPCSNFGSCTDCKSRDRICCHYVITGRQNVVGRIKVIIVKDNLGY